MKTVRDCKGREIREYDVLKVYHFTGARNKKHYMYKWVRTYGGELYAKHLDSESDSKFGGYLLWCVASENGVIEGTEVVQSFHEDS